MRLRVTQLKAASQRHSSNEAQWGFMCVEARAEAQPKACLAAATGAEAQIARLTLHNEGLLSLESWGIAWRSKVAVYLRGGGGGAGAHM